MIRFFLPFTEREQQIAALCLVGGFAWGEYYMGPTLDKADTNGAVRKRVGEFLSGKGDKKKIIDFFKSEFAKGGYDPEKAIIAARKKFPETPYETLARYERHSRSGG